jgi:hypothetical protein
VKRKTDLFYIERRPPTKNTRLFEIEERESLWSAGRLDRSFVPQVDDDPDRPRGINRRIAGTPELQTTSRTDYDSGSARIIAIADRKTDLESLVRADVGA